MNSCIKLFAVVSFFLVFIYKFSFAQIVENIEVKGNDRISKETILIFSSVSEGEDVSMDKINNILINLYETNYFENVEVSIEDKKLIILVKENPIVENISFNGIKSKNLKKDVLRNVKLKSRVSYNELLIKEDKNSIISALKNYGYYNPKVDVFVENISNNKVNINFDIDIGSKAKIKKITFIGNKIFKDSKLKSIIISEEYKFWKIISGKKFLNENIVKYDLRLLKNFYLNKGYFNVKINSSFAKILNNNFLINAYQNL